MFFDVIFVLENMSKLSFWSTYEVWNESKNWKF